MGITEPLVLPAEHFPLITTIGNYSLQLLQ